MARAGMREWVVGGGPGGDGISPLCSIGVCERAIVTAWKLASKHVVCFWAGAESSTVVAGGRGRIDWAGAVKPHPLGGQGQKGCSNCLKKQMSYRVTDLSTNEQKDQQMKRLIGHMACDKIASTLVLCT